LPIEFIKAMPPAAAEPVRKPVGGRDARQDRAKPLLSAFREMPQGPQPHDNRWHALDNEQPLPSGKAQRAIERIENKS
jgi:hypothetical protein